MCSCVGECVACAPGSRDAVSRHVAPANIKAQRVFSLPITTIRCMDMRIGSVTSLHVMITRQSRHKSYHLFQYWGVSTAHNPPASLTSDMAADRCIDCDLGLFAFHLKYSGKPKDLVDLCISHKLILQ